MIHAALPNARIIHMRRNPLDTCLSIYFNNFHVMHTYANDIDDLADYYDQYLRVMAHWRCVRSCRPRRCWRLPTRISSPITKTWRGAIVEIVGLPWDPACLEFQRGERSVSTFSKWQVRQRINRASVERWRNYEPFVGPLLRLTAGTAAA